MITHNFSETASCINLFLAEMRDEKVQKDPLRFRTNLERFGTLVAYEISKTLHYGEIEVATPLGIANCTQLQDQVVIASILRAGLPLHNGMLALFDHAQSAFIAAYRKYGRDYKFTIQLEYVSCPPLDNKIVVLADPLLATGSSICLAYQALLEKGTPKHTHIVSAVASREGYEYLCRKLHQANVTLWVGAIDEELTTKSYIVPGMGDVGDLAYGFKNV